MQNMFGVRDANLTVLPNLYVLPRLTNVPELQFLIVSIEPDYL